jgi:predicted metal-dependent HD superfamily phosphohydrolase
LKVSKVTGWHPFAKQRIMRDMDRITLFAELAPNGREDKLRTPELWTLLGKLVRRYIEPHRRYHTLQHLDYGFRQHNRFFGGMYSDTFFAWVYHDAICDPKARDNEEKSAELFLADNSVIGFTPNIAKSISEDILRTKHHGEKSILTDVDLSILGAEWRVYDEYVKQIRQEYDFVNETEWKVGRSAVLERFLAQPSIFFTAQFGELEEAAQKNLTRELKRLKKN